MEYLLVYPLNDVREVRQINVTDCNGSNYVSKPIDDYYMAKNFDAIARYAALTGIQSNITYEDLTTNSVEKLKKINSDGEEYVMILYLSELQYSGLSTTFTTSMEGFLVCVDSGRIAWHDSIKDTKWLGLIGGPLDRLFGTAGYSDPCQMYGIVLAKMLTKFPKLTRPGKGSPGEKGDVRGAH
jgi:hypothetical protein